LQPQNIKIIAAQADEIGGVKGGKRAGFMVLKVAVNI